jgi:hypothetical protein
MTMPRGNFNNLMSLKDSEARCLQHEEMLDGLDNRFSWMVGEQREEMLNYTAQFAHVNGMCRCNPAHNGVVWSKVMAQSDGELLTNDQLRSKMGRPDTYEEFLQEVRLDTQAFEYRRSQLNFEE